jgi:hypothetical protein
MTLIEIFEAFLHMSIKGLMWNHEHDNFTKSGRFVFEAMIAMAEDCVMSPNVKDHPMRRMQAEG